MLFEFQNRILTMSEVHNFMYKADNYHKIEFSGVMDKIIENVRKKYENSTAKILNVSEKILLPIETAIPCAMILNELLNNCLMHAFKDSKDSKIEVKLFKSKDHYTLSVKDNGVGIPTSVDLKKAQTTGFTLIYILSQQIRGNLAFSSDRGLTSTLEF